MHMLFKIYNHKFIVKEFIVISHLSFYLPPPPLIPTAKTEY